MSIKLVLLKSGETLITDARELISTDNNVCGYLFENPHIVKVSSPLILTNDPDKVEDTVEVSFTPWITLSIDKGYSVPTDWVVTISEPLSNITKLYEEKINVKDSEVSFTES